MANTDVDVINPTTVERPLNQTQLKNLERLVVGDFTDLKATVTAEIETRLNKRLQAIEVQYANEDGLNKARTKLIELGRKMEDQLRAHHAKLVSEGFSLGPKADRYGNRISTASIAVSTGADGLQVAGKSEALSRAKAAAQRLQNSATRVLASNERKVLRLVLLQGISAQAALELINDLPEADDILSLVQQEMEANQSEDVEELFGNPKKVVPALD